VAASHSFACTRWMVWRWLRDSAYYAFIMIDTLWDSEASLGGFFFEVFFGILEIPGLDLHG